MRSSFRTLLIVALLFYCTGVTGGSVYTVGIKITPPVMVENVCHTVETDLLTDGDKQEAQSRDDEYNYEIRSEDMNWRFVSKDAHLTFGWVLKKSTQTTIRVVAQRVALHNYDSSKTIKAYSATIRELSLEMFYKTKIDKVVPIDQDIIMKVNYVGQKDIEQSFKIITYWYENCKLLSSPEANNLVHNFKEALKTYEVVVAVELVFNGEISEVSPYNCDTDILKPAPKYNPQKMIGPSGSKLFTCKEDSKHFGVTGLARMKVITMDSSDLTAGKIALIQGGHTRADSVTAKEEVTFSVQLEGKDKDRFQKSKNNSIYWYVNCKFLKETQTATLVYIFPEQENYEIVAVILAYFDGIRNETEPYDCKNSELKLQNYLCATGVFRKTVAARETIIKNALLSIIQRDKTIEKVVAIDETFTININLTGIDAELFGKAASKTFWFMNCTLLGTSIDKNFQHMFTIAEMYYKISAVVVISHSGDPPEEPPYDCSTDTLKKDADYAIGVFHRIYVTRDQIIRNGRIELVQNEETRKYYVASKESFSLSIQLDANVTKLLSRVRSRRTFWFADCILLDGNVEEPFEHVFNIAFQKFKIVGVFIAMFDGVIPSAPPYDCSNNRLTTDLNYGVGAFHAEYFTRVLKLQSRYGKVVLVQGDRPRRHFIATNVPFNLQIHLEESTYDDVFRNTKSNTTFWFKNCVYLGSTRDPNFEASFEDPFQMYKVVGVLVAMYNGTPPTDPPYDCSSNTIREDINYAVGAVHGEYYARDLTLNENKGRVYLVQGGHTRTHVVAPNVPFFLKIKLDAKYETFIQNAESAKTFWYSNCTFLGEAPSTTLKGKWTEVDQKHYIVGVIVLTYKGTPPIDAPYFCSNNSIAEDENYSVGVFHNEYVTRATKLADGHLIFEQKGFIRNGTVATDTLNMSLLLEAAHQKVVHEARDIKVFWHRGCTLIGESTATSALAIFRKPFQRHEIVAVLVAIYAGSQPSKSPYICSNRTAKDDIKYTMATFFGKILTKEQIRDVNIEGKTSFRSTEMLKLKISFRGNPPYEYCAYVYSESYKKTDSEDCHYPEEYNEPELENTEGGPPVNYAADKTSNNSTGKSKTNPPVRSINEDPVKSNDNMFVYNNKFDPGKQLILFIIKNEVSKEVIPVPIHSMKVLQVNLKCLGGCD